MAKPSGPWQSKGERSWVRWYSAEKDTPIKARILLHLGRRQRTYEWAVYGPGMLSWFGHTLGLIDLDGGITKSLAAAKRAADRAARLVN